jgi:YD repeat-containing protein
MKKKILFFSMFALLAGTAAAQTVQFAYDEAGNRISRTITLRAPALRSGEAEPDATPLLEEQLATDLLVKIYPNPTEGLLQVELSEMETDETAQLALFGLNGENLLQTTATSQLTPVDMSKYPTGVYVLRLVIRGNPVDYKIVKQ